MPRGGKREGAGRKFGSATVKTREIANAAAAGGILPLDYMLAVLRDEKTDKARRDDMARSAAPYIHPRLSSIDATTRTKTNLSEYSVDELAAELLQRQGAGSRVPAQGNGAAEPGCVH